MVEKAKQHNAITWNWVKGWLPLIISLIIIVASVAAWGPRLDVMEAKQATQEVKIEALAEMRVQLAEMGRDIEWIRERLDREP